MTPELRLCWVKGHEVAGGPLGGCNRVSIMTAPVHPR